MPTYAYECERCGHRFELLQGITDPPRQRCPECRGKVRRLLLPGGGLIFKGSGFYITDYKRKESQTGQGARGRDDGSPSRKTEDGGQPVPSAPKKTDPREKSGKQAKPGPSGRGA
jgi:putative FmdB family regulatory protein